VLSGRTRSWLAGQGHTVGAIDSDVNRATWAHVLRAVAGVAAVDEAVYLVADEREALDGRRNPTGVIVPPPRS